MISSVIAGGPKRIFRISVRQVAAVFPADGARIFKRSPVDGLNGCRVLIYINKSDNCSDFTQSISGVRVTAEGLEERRTTIAS